MQSWKIKFEHTCGLQKHPMTIGLQIWTATIIETLEETIRHKSLNI